MPLHVSSTLCSSSGSQIALHSLWCHHTYRCDVTRGCLMQFWPFDDEHMCSKHAQAWNKLIVKQKFCASSRLITEINEDCVLDNLATFQERPNAWFCGKRLPYKIWTLMLNKNKFVMADSNLSKPRVYRTGTGFAFKNISFFKNVF